MNNDQYQKEALRTDYEEYSKVAERLNNNAVARLIHAGMGLSTEGNEFLNALKKHVIYGKELDRTNLIEELSDVCWFLAIACDELNVSISSVMDINIKKLKARYPNKFSEHEALNRDLDKERKLLVKKPISPMTLTNIIQFIIFAIIVVFLISCNLLAGYLFYSVFKSYKNNINPQNSSLKKENDESIKQAPK